MSMREQTATLSDLVSALRAERSDDHCAANYPTAPTICRSQLQAVARCSPPLSAGSARLVVVAGAHAQAGASSVALAVAEAAAVDFDDELVDNHAYETARTSGNFVSLLDGSPVGTSGLASAAEQELGRDDGGWRQGRRGTLIIRRPPGGLADVSVVSASDLQGRQTGAMTSPGDAPASASVVDHAPLQGRVVVDIGSPVSEVLNLLDLDQVGSPVDVVVVCRATIPSATRAERELTNLAALNDDLRGSHQRFRAPIVVMLGARRCPSEVEALLGPHMQAARADRRFLVVPLNRRFEVRGIDTHPLPRALTAAGSRIADLLELRPHY